MLVVQSYCPQDEPHALRFAEWLRDMGGVKGHRLILIQDTRIADKAKVPCLYRESFDSVEVMPFTDHYQRWPDAPNAVFGMIARHIEAEIKEPWLFVEPDCVPLKPEWLDLLWREYLTARKPFLGDFVNVNGVVPHCSGNAIYPARMTANAGFALIAGDIAFDVAAAEQIVPHMHHSALLHHAWKHQGFRDWAQFEREVLAFKPECALFHADKNGTLYPLLRQRMMILSGGVESRHAARLTSRREQSSPTIQSSGSGATIPRSEQSLREVASSGSSAPPAQNLICDLYIKTYAPDFNWLAYCLRSIDKFCSGFRQVVIVTPDPYQPPAMRVPVQVIVTPQQLPDGYLDQQLFKLNAHQFTDAPFILLTDSDTIFTQSVTPQTYFAEDSRPNWLITPYVGNNLTVPWRPYTEKFLGEVVAYEFMRRQPFMVPRSALAGLSAFCETKHGIHLADYIGSQPLRAFSEYNALGAWLYRYHRDTIHWVDTEETPPEEWPDLTVDQRYSHGGLSPQIHAEFEKILGSNERNNNEGSIQGGAGILDRMGSDGDTRDGVRDNGEHGSSLRSSVHSGDSGLDRLRNLDEQAVNPRIKQTKEGIWVLVTDSHLSRWIEEHGSLQHDYQTLPEVLTHIHEGDYVIDAGAFVGDTTKPFLDRVGLTGKVFAIEPNFDACDCLRRNLGNRVNILIFPFAVGAPDDPMLELAPDTNAGGRHLRKFGFDKEQGEGVDVATIDGIDVPKCDFIKLDIEGYELHALRGAEQTIAKFRPKLLIEINPGALDRQGTTPEDIYQWLRAHHYEWRELVPSDGGESPQTDILCVPQSKVELRIKNEELPNSSFLIPPSATLTPWQDKTQTLEHIAELGRYLRRFCTTPRYTGFVRDVLREQKVIR